MQIKRSLSAIFLLPLLLGTATKSTAQSGYFRASVLGGLNFCQVDGDRFAGYNKLGVNLGIRIDHKVDETWSGGFELLLSTKGSKRVLDPNDPIRQIFVIKSQYIELPLFVRYNIAAVKNLSAHGGFSIGANIGGTVDDGIQTYDANFARTETAFFIGGDYKLGDHLSIMLRHSNSLFRIGDQYPNARNWVNRVGLYNRIYMLSLVYHL
ncbi:MAG: outer membrane beta-barrel protein [Bacteroidetes bacterium]|nr:outer membrane beta-barrel protein [Bacteroidota bacterium]